MRTRSNRPPQLEGPCLKRPCLTPSRPEGLARARENAPAPAGGPQASFISIPCRFFPGSIPSPFSAFWRQKGSSLSPSPSRKRLRGANRRGFSLLGAPKTWAEWSKLEERGNRPKLGWPSFVNYAWQARIGELVLTDWLRQAVLRGLAWPAVPLASPRLKRPWHGQTRANQ